MRAFNRFQGDPALQITLNGADMRFIGGQPVMDQGVNNAALISLFTKRGWWGNVLFTDVNQKIGADFEEIRTIVDVQTLNDYNDAARGALKWMTDSGLASRVDVDVTNPVTNQIRTTVAIYPPGQDLEELKFLKNGINWISQAANPAHERL
jgi:phage gp46-like protein